MSIRRCARVSFQAGVRRRSSGTPTRRAREERSATDVTGCCLVGEDRRARRLVRSDETPAEHHPVTRPEFRPPTDVRGDRCDDHRNHDVLPFPRLASHAIQTGGFGKVLRREGGARRHRPHSLACRRLGPIQKGFLMLSNVRRRLSGRLFRVAVVIARHATQSFQNWTPSLLCTTRAAAITAWCDRSPTVPRQPIGSAVRPLADCPGALPGATMACWISPLKD